MSINPYPDASDRDALVAWYRRNRRRSEELFALIPDASWLDRPIALRNPVCFYEGHIPAFGVNTLWKGALGHPGIRPDYEILFEPGIDPEEVPTGTGAGWPARSEVVAYGRETDQALERALREEPLVSQDNPLLRRSEAVLTVLEHEVMHQETLHYMWRRLPYDRKGPRGSLPAPRPDAARPPRPERTSKGPASTMPRALPRASFAVYSGSRAAALQAPVQLSPTALRERLTRRALPPTRAAATAQVR